jgi:hypothetical protein
VQSQNKHSQEIKYFLPAAGKETMGLTSKPMSSLNKENMRILFGKSIHIHRHMKAL